MTADPDFSINPDAMEQASRAVYARAGQLVDQINSSPLNDLDGIGKQYPGAAASGADAPVVGTPIPTGAEFAVGGSPLPISAHFWSHTFQARMTDWTGQYRANCARGLQVLAVGLADVRLAHQANDHDAARSLAPADVDNIFNPPKGKGSLQDRFRQLAEEQRHGKKQKHGK